MRYEEVIPEDYLLNFVKCFWTSETLTKSAEYTILPDGFFDLIVVIKSGHISTIKLTGIWTNPIDIESQTNSTIFAVRFKPIAAELFEGINFKSILNSSIKLDLDFWEISDLTLTNFNLFCKYIEKHLIKLIERNKSINNVKINLFNEIFKKEIFCVQELSEKIFWTNRQINRYFNMTLGLSLKEYLNIIRCNRTFKDIANNKLMPQRNFYDQSHYIKDIKRYTGVTPKELNRNENDRFLQLLTIKRT